MTDRNRIIRHALGLGPATYPYRNHYVAAPTVTLERMVEDGLLVMVPDTDAENRYHVTMDGLAAIGIELKELGLVTDPHADDICPKCHGTGGIHEILTINDRPIPTFEVLDCPACDCEGRLRS